MRFAANIRLDLGLTVVFPILAVSGFAVHVTDEIASHDLWHTWAVIHVISALLFLALGLAHIIGHWWAGLLMILFAVIHLVRRWGRFRSGLSRLRKH